MDNSKEVNKHIEKIPSNANVSKPLRHIQGITSGDIPESGPLSPEQKRIALNAMIAGVLKKPDVFAQSPNHDESNPFSDDNVIGDPFSDEHASDSVNQQMANKSLDIHRKSIDEVIRKLRPDLKKRIENSIVPEFLKEIQNGKTSDLVSDFACKTRYALEVPDVYLLDSKHNTIKPSESTKIFKEWLTVEIKLHYGEVNVENVENKEWEIIKKDLVEKLNSQLEKQLPKQVKQQGWKAMNKWTQESGEEEKSKLMACYRKYLDRKVPSDEVEYARVELGLNMLE